MPDLDSGRWIENLAVRPLPNEDPDVLDEVAEWNIPSATLTHMGDGRWEVYTMGPAEITIADVEAMLRIMRSAL